MAILEMWQMQFSTRMKPSYHLAVPELSKKLSKHSWFTFLEKPIQPKQSPSFHWVWFCQKGDKPLNLKISCKCWLPMLTAIDIPATL